MIINRIDIRNFLCYYGTDNQFAFSEGLNIVLGANGYGKSKLYDAFQWVFSDGITDNSPRAAAGGLKATSAVKGDLVSEKAKAQCAIGDSVETSVTIEVSYPRNAHQYVAEQQYQLIRTYRVRRIDEKTWAEPGKSEFQIMEFDIKSFKPVPESKYEEILERLLPVDVKPYVWFQGERGISNLIDTTSSNALRNVIKRLSDIERWDRYIQVAEKAHDTAKNAFDQELKKSQKNQVKINELQTEQRKLQQRTEQLDQLITNASLNQKAAKNTAEELVASIEFARQINTLTSARDQVATNHQRAIKQVDVFSEGLSRNLFTDQWVLLGTADLLNRFEQKKSNYEAVVNMRIAIANINKETSQKLQNRLPLNVPEPMHIRDMLEREHCLVCDRAAKEGTDAYNAIAGLLPKEQVVIPAEPHRTDLSGLFKRLYANGLSLQASIDGIAHRVGQSMQAGENLKQQVDQLSEELAAKRRELQEAEQTSGLTDARSIANSMQIANEDTVKYGLALSKFNDEIEKIEKRQNAIDAELIDLSKDYVPAHLTKKKELLFDLMQLAKRTKETKYRELVQQLEDAANEHYRNINAPTGAFFGRIQFMETADGGYRPVIIDTDGTEKNNLNTSLMSSLKLSIIMAIVSANKTRNYAAVLPAYLRCTRV